LSSIDLLPDKALPHVRDAIEALKKRDRTQEDIREELNTHLLALGENPVSKSAFNRKALQVAAFGEQLRQAREVAAIMAEKLDEAPEGDVGLLLNETIKALIYDVVMEQSLSDESASVGMLKSAAQSLMRLEQARKMSIETRARIMRDFAGKADEAVTRASKQAGLTKDQVAQIRREVLGVVKK
jgi:hypothetical protein